MQTTRNPHGSHHRLIIAVGWLVVGGLLAGFVFAGFGIVFAQDGGGLSDQEAQKHLALGKMYEEVGEWDMALQEYQTAAQANSNELVGDAQQGIQRVIVARKSYVKSVGADLGSLLKWFTGIVIRVLIIVAALYVLIRFVLYLINRRSTWSMIPFLDMTGNKLGEAVAESIAATVENARFLHVQASSGVLKAFEDVAVPGFRARAHQESFLNTLRVMDSLDVSGVGLPVGSILASIVRWIDMGQSHILGVIQQQDERHVCIIAQLKKGRTSENVSVWIESAELSAEGLQATLYDLERRLAFRILFDTKDSKTQESKQKGTQKGWGACTATSLMYFTDALDHMQRFEASPTIQETELKEAEKSLTAALEVDPTYVSARYDLALVHHNLGQHSKAVEGLKVLRSQPGHGLDLEIAYLMGAAYYQYLASWAYDLAEEEFKQVVEALSQADRERSPRDPELLALVRCGLASIYAQRIELEKKRRNDEKAREYLGVSKEHYDQALEADPQDPVTIATAHTAYGLALLNNYQFDEAIAAFDQALQASPSYWRAYLHRGRAQIKAGKYDAGERKYDEGEQSIRQALRLNPDSEYAHFQLGLALKGQGRLDEAYDEFLEAPGNAYAHDELGKILADERGQYDEAIDEFERALVIKHEFANAMANLAWYTMEGGFDDDARLERALTCAQQALKLEKEKETSNAANRHWTLGRVYFSRNDLPRAEQEFQEAVRLAPERPEGHFFLAQLYLKRDELEKARVSLVKVKDLRPPQKSPWYDKARQRAIEQLKEINARLKTRAKGELTSQEG